MRFPEAAERLRSGRSRLIVLSATVRTVSRWQAGNPDLQVQWCPPQVKGGKTRAHITRAD